MLQTHVGIIDTYLMVLKKVFPAVFVFFFLFRIHSPILSQELTREERIYIESHGPITMCVDPDWYPYEQISPEGEYVGIASELITLMATRLGITIELVPTVDWAQSIEYAKSGKCDILPFLNKTPQRDEWLLFTAPYFSDQNVLITREQHDYIGNLAGIRGETVVLPEGTSIEERLRADFPNLTVITTDSENSVFRMLEERKADMTLRSLTMAAYTIKKDGWFNLKIAGEVPEYTNYLRIGVVADNSILRDILNKGVQTITPEDVQQAVNKHISIKIANRIDYVLILRIVVSFLIIFILGLVWILQLRKLNRKLLVLTEKLHHMAEYDHLTNLPNRALFFDRLQQGLQYFHRHKLKCAVLFIDLDGFKSINDRFGHDAGDRVLQEAASRIQNVIRKSDTAARFGGDEFVVFLSGIDTSSSVLNLASKICTCFEDPVDIGTESIRISVSIGVAVCPDHGHSDHDLIKNADSAMYRSKVSGKNRVSLYNAE